MRAARLGVAAAVLVAAAAFATAGRWPWRRLPSPAPPAAAPRPVVSRLTDLDLLRVDTSHSLDPRRLRARLVFSFRRPDSAAAPTEVSVRTGPARRLVFARDTAGWHTSVDSIAWRSETMRIEGGIDNSLYEALDAQVGDDQLDGADRQRLAWDLADVYAWQVDFTRDIQPGDSFQVVFERLISEDGEVRFGRVLAADLTMSGKSLTAFRFGSDGRSAFYDADGNSLRRAFLRAPVQFRRISSGFARARFHPILGIMRKHEGTDYAAAPGTPVMAAGDGVVVRAG